MVSSSGSRALSAAELCDKIASRNYTIGVMGLGYVGLPLALVSARAGFRVLGFDTDAQRVEQLNLGISSIKHISDASISSALSDGKFRATGKFTELQQADAVLIAVPTPLNRAIADILALHAEGGGNV